MEALELVDESGRMNSARCPAPDAEGVCTCDEESGEGFLMVDNEDNVGILPLDPIDPDSPNLQSQ